MSIVKTIALNSSWLVESVDAEEPPYGGKTANDTWIDSALLKGQLYMDISHYLHSFISWTFGFFAHFGSHLSYYEYLCVSICTKIYLWLFWITAESSDKSMLNFMRICQTVFQRHYTILHAHQKSIWVPIPLHPCQYLFFHLKNKQQQKQ